MAARSSRFSAMLFTVVAFALAVCTAWLTWQWVAQGGRANPTTPIGVAARRVEAGHPSRPEDLRVVPWPSESIPQGSFADPAALVHPPARVATGGLAAGEPVIEERLASPQA